MHDSTALFDPWTRDYALLGLQLDRILPGTVLAWLGPPAWRATIDDSAPPAPATLRAAADTLLARLPGMNYDPERAAHLARQTIALSTLADLAAGTPLAFAEQVERLLDLRPTRTPEETFAAAHAELNTLLPGRGPLAARYDDWLRASAIPVTHLPTVLDRVAAELRTRTARQLPLPEGARVEFALGPDLPYSAYTRYLGRARSRIEINTRVPLHPAQIIDYLAHETYPGHHTEHAMREEYQYRQRGQGEYAIQLSPTPDALIWEAIATAAPDVIFAPGEGLAWLAATVLPSVGLTIEPERDDRIWAARRVLDAAQGNAAALLHEDRLPPADVADYLARWMLLPAAASTHFVTLLHDLPWRVYALTYSHGPRLLAPLLANATPFATLHHLMTTPIYPALLSSNSTTH